MTTQPTTWSVTYQTAAWIDTLHRRHSGPDEESIVQPLAFALACLDGGEVVMESAADRVALRSANRAFWQLPEAQRESVVRVARGVIRGDYAGA
jgi:hypothetical protein